MPAPEQPEPPAARSPMRAVAAAVVFVLVGVGLGAVTPSAACACSTKVPAAIATMQAELRLLEQFQRDFLADSGRMAARSDLEAAGWRVSGSLIELAAFEVSDSSFRAVMTSPSYVPGGSCTVSLQAADLRDEPGREDTLTCEGLPDPGIQERGVTQIYAALVVLALIVRFAVAGRSRPPVSVLTILGMLAFAAVHPFWFLWKNPSWCDEGLSVAYLWMAFVVVYIARTAFLGTYTPPGTHPPPAPPTPRPPGPRQFR